MKEILEKIDKMNTTPYSTEERNFCYTRGINDVRKLILSEQSEQKDPNSFKKYFMELYGQGLEVSNWHLNGDMEPLDNFIDSALEFEAEPSPITIGDKIRESNESLAQAMFKYRNGVACSTCGLNSRTCGYQCGKGLLTYLNQPSIDAS